MSIVYDSVGSGGNLFEGKTFWIAQRVPQRLRWEQAIKANGGNVTPLEKNADILIADHARNGAPPGSYSWTFIEASVKNGKLEKLEDHPAGPAIGYIRPVGSSMPTKTSRTPFSTEDDRVLAEWVTKAERQGLSTKGNKIYEDLARINPRHTMQSWRDRWVKHLSNRPRPEIAPDAAYDGLASRQAAAKSTRAEQNRRVLQQAPSATENIPSPFPSSYPSQYPQSPAASKAAKPTSGQPFTETDANLLEEIYEDIENIDEAQVIAAWNAWAVEHPQHTADEWFKYWVTKIKGKRNPHRNTEDFSGTHPTVPVSEEAQTKITKSPQSSQGVVSPFHPIKSQPKDIGEHLQHRMRDEKVREVFNKEEVFLAWFRAFCEAQSADVDMRPSVCGRHVPLFALWSTANRGGNKGFEQADTTRRWQKIATDLNFNTFRFATAAEQLREVYEHSLVDFEEFLDTLKEVNVVESPELTDTQMIDLQLQTQILEDFSNKAWTEVEHDGEYDNDLEKQSPAVKSTNLLRKRPLPPEGPSLDKPDQQTTRFDKRQRSKPEDEVEIPSTPEEKLFSSPKISRSSRVISSEPAADPETQDFYFSHNGQAADGQPPALPEHDLADSVGNPPGTESRHEMTIDSSTQSQIDSLADEADLQAVIDQYVALGYPEEIVFEALKATTMETGDIAVVMEALMNNQGVPSNIQGVWTLQDDRLVGSPEHPQYRSIISKHGRERCAKRRQFLKDSEEAMRELVGDLA